MKLFIRVIKNWVSTIILVLCIGVVIGHFVGGGDYTSFVVIPAAFILFTTIDKELFLMKLDRLIKDKDLREDLGLPLYNFKIKPSVFEVVTLVLIVLVCLFILITFYLYVIGVPIPILSSLSS